MFIYPAFINKNNSELRNKLEELGYEPSTIDNHKGLYLWTSDNGCYYSSNNHLSNKYGEYVEPYGIFCEDSEELFFAITALRDDNDYMQWFILNADCGVDRKLVREWVQCNMKSAIEFFNDISYNEIYHKATVDELIENFKIK